MTPLMASQRNDKTGHLYSFINELIFHDVSKKIWDTITKLYVQMCQRSAIMPVDSCDNDTNDDVIRYKLLYSFESL